MGALAPLTHWLPQDDLLLKNSIEAGASLEALAKGAVKFSRRFSLQELQSRWHSLLYDPVVATEASDRMIEPEFSQLKRTDGTSKKRKTESVRKCYYTMVKRICNEPLCSMDLSLLDLPVFDIGGSEPMPTSCLSRDQASSYNETQELRLEPKDGSCIEFGTNGDTSLATGLSASALSSDKENLAVSQSNFVQDFHLPEKNISLTEDQISNCELGPSKELMDSNMFESVYLEGQKHQMIGHTDDKEAIVLSGCECKVSNSSISSSLTSLENAGYGSPVIQMPVLDTAEGISGPIDHDTCLVDNIPHADNDPQILGGIDIAHSDSVHVISELADPTCSYMMEFPGDNFPAQATCSTLEKVAPNAEDYIEQLSNSLFSFSAEDEILLMDAGKEIMDDLSSLLMDYPNEGDMQSLGVSEATVSLSECFDLPNDAPYGELRNEEQYDWDDQRQVFSADVQKLSSALKVNPMFPERWNGVICCTLNTEDPEIPDNDDVFLPINLTATSISWMENAKRNEIFYPIPFAAEEFSHNCIPTDNYMVGEERTNNIELSSPHPVTEQLQGSICQQNDNGLRFELPCSDLQHVFKKGASDYPDQSVITQVSMTDITPGSLNESLIQVEKAEEPMDKSGGSQNTTYDLGACLTIQKEAAVCKLEAELVQNNDVMLAELDQNNDVILAELDQNNDVILAELDLSTKTDPKQSINCTLSDQEVLSNESEGEVPCLSDVEAMIYDMDLSPDDFPVVHHSPGVAVRYQDEGERKTILRLEKAAEACMQRSIAAQGAFAVLYGRHTKYFIKKPEVLLGRGTEDVEVDIDLGRECHANKISRRQATLKLETDGMFHLRNHGKFPIFVNGQEIMPGHTFILDSGCLIEIRGIAFLFETNKKLCRSVYCLN